MAEKLPEAGSGETPTPTQEKTVDITKNGTVEVTPDDGYALSKVTANVDVPIPDGYIVPSGTKEVTENGEHDVTEYASVNVNVPAGGGITPDEIATATIPGDIVLSSTTSIVTYAFYGNSMLKSVSAPNVKSIGAYAFYNCDSFTSLNAPNVTSLGKWALAEGGISEVVFPLVTAIPERCFSGCFQIKKADWGAVESIAINAFYYCSKLTTLILRKEDAIATLANTNALGNQFKTGAGYIYVPSALVDSYKSATNWSTFAAHIRAIEDYPKITGG